MKTVILVSLICILLFLSCTERKEVPNEVVPPQAVVNAAPQNTRSEASIIAEQKAIRLVKKDAALRHKGSLDRYEIIATELDNGWRITVQLKVKSPMIMGGTTEYFIDKEGNKVTDVKIYQ